MRAIQSLTNPGVLVASTTSGRLISRYGRYRIFPFVGLPVGIGFTVELDGRLPDGTPLADAIEAVDSICAPTHYGVNCAHPTHIERGVADQSPQLRRIAVVRANASELSHAELDEAEVLDDGDPVALAAAVASLRERLPGLRVVGGCCGTDARHVAAMWGVSA